MQERVDISLLTAIKSCTNTRDLDKGKSLHEHLVSTGLASNIYLASSLINMYSKCGRLSEARKVFESMPRRDVVSWNSLLTGHVENGEEKIALNLFHYMQRECSCAPDSRTFVAALKACVSLAVEEEARPINGKLVKTGALKNGVEIHIQAEKLGCCSSLYVGNTLIVMYGKCGRPDEARKVFDGMKQRDQVSWNVLLVGYTENGEEESALECFRLMYHLGEPPGCRTFVAVLKSISALAAKEDWSSFRGKLVKTEALEKVMAVHSLAVKLHCELEVFVASTLVDAYSKCGSISDGLQVFRRMPFRDLVSWNALLLGCADNGETGLAMELLGCMREEGCTPNARTFVAVIKACINFATEEEPQELGEKLVKVRSLERGMALHSQAASSGWDSNIFVASTLIDLYTECGSISDGIRVFTKVPRRDLSLWTTMIMGYTTNRDGLEALKLFEQMISDGVLPDSQSFAAALNACTGLATEERKLQSGTCFRYLEIGMALHSEAAKLGFDSDKFVATALVETYSSCGSIEDSVYVFDRIRHLDAVLWNAVIDNGEGELALDFFTCMRVRDGYEPALLFGSVLKACQLILDMNTGRATHGELCRTGHDDDTVLVTSLMDLYSRCGNLCEARRMFESVGNRDVVTWSVLLAGYSHRGDYEEVLRLFQDMKEEGFQANAISFVCILNACSHAGLVETGRKLLEVMGSEYGIIPDNEHCSCVVDMLGRANQLEEAVSVVRGMGLESSTVAWTTVLSACWKWKNVEVGRIDFESLVKLDARNSSAYMLMANIYGGAGMLEEENKVDERASALSENSFMALISGRSSSSSVCRGTRGFSRSLTDLPWYFPRQPVVRWADWSCSSGWTGRA